MPDKWRIVRLNAHTGPLTEAEREILSALDPEIVEIEGTGDEEILSAARDCDAMMVISAYVRGSVIGKLTRCPRHLAPRDRG